MDDQLDVPDETLDPCLEDVCGDSHVDGFQEVEKLADSLIAIGFSSDLVVSEEEQNEIKSCFLNLKEHDKQLKPTEFNVLYMTKFKTQRIGKFATRYQSPTETPSDAALRQILALQNLSSRPAHVIDYQKNRLVYAIMLKLAMDIRCCNKQGVPDKTKIFNLYNSIHLKVLAENHKILSKIHLPLASTNPKRIGDFLKASQVQATLRALPPSATLSKLDSTTSSGSSGLLPKDRPVIVPATYRFKESTAGTRTVRARKRPDDLSE